MQISISLSLVRGADAAGYGTELAYGSVYASAMRCAALRPRVELHAMCVKRDSVWRSMRCARVRWRVAVMSVRVLCGAASSGRALADGGACNVR
eukprot:547447-Rhodomonas_salina.2